MKDKVKQEVEKCLRIFCEQKKCVIEELNVQEDHVHLLVKIPPKVSVSNIVGMLKGRTAIRVFSKFRNLKEKPDWGDHFGQKDIVLILLAWIRK